MASKRTNTEASENAKVGEAQEQPRSSRSSTHRGRWHLVLIAGVLLIGVALGLVVFNLNSSQDADKQTRAVLNDLDGQIEQAAEAAAAAASSADTSGAITWQLDRDMPTLEVDGRDYLGVLSIPSLDIELPIVAAWDEDAERFCAWRYSGSYYTDDLVLGGFNYASQLGPLLNAQIGAEVYLTNVDGRRIRYVISNRENLRATADGELSQNRQNSDSVSDWDLTLFTSDLSGSTRCVVRCVRQ